MKPIHISFIVLQSAKNTFITTLFLPFLFTVLCQEFYMRSSKTLGGGTNEYFSETEGELLKS